MTIDGHHLRSRRFADVTQSVEPRDAALYALSLGVGSDPLDPDVLPFVYEGAPGGLRVLPTLAVVLGYPGFWARDCDTGIDWMRLLHGEQRLTVHRPLPTGVPLVGRNRVTHVVDKGAGRGALVVVHRALEDTCGTRYAEMQQVMFCRGDGGWSARPGQASDEPLPALPPVPQDRAPDAVYEQRTRPEAALLYRLLADPNPLHADPAVARAAGFERPILHGLASYGIACHAVVRCCAGNDPARLRSLDLRFTAPVYPGETLRTELWRVGEGRVALQTRVLERDVLVLSHGEARLD